MMLRSAVMSLGLASAVLLAAAAHAQQPADNRAKDEAAIRQADEAWVKAAQTKQIPAWLAYYTDDILFMPPNDKIAKTKDDITKYLGQMMILPGLKVTWQPVKIEAARSGDIAYDHGTYELTFEDPNGNPITDKGKYLEIWKKQADGSWKCSADMWNSDLPN